MSYLVMNDITKDFPGVRALDNVTIELERGEILGLVGENGAGKSTLMKILTGLLVDYRGDIIIDGAKKLFSSPIESIRTGISYIPQELNLIPKMRVYENILLGQEISDAGFIINYKKMFKVSETILNNIGVEINVNDFVENLGTGSQQLVEIARALSIKSKIIIMDEPTSALTSQEIEKLFDVISNLAKNGTSTIYISHKLEEVLTIANRIAVLKDGKLVGRGDVKEFDKNKLISMMVGHDVSQEFRQSTSKYQDVILEVKNLHYKDKVKDISFSVKAGEVLGIAGLMGSGRTELLKSIFGILRLEKGEIIISNKKTDIKNPLDAIKNGMGLVPEDRKKEGLILKLNVADNIVLSILNKVSKFGIILNRLQNKYIKEYIQYLNIKVASSQMLALNLSGGNQQKTVIAKWLATSPKLLLLDEATHGIDVGAKDEIYNLIRSFSEKGIAIIMVSSELAELIGLCDRIIVIRDGAMMGVLSHEEANEEKIMKLAMGG